MRRQIVLWGPPQDEVLRAVRSELDRRNEPCLWLDQQQGYCADIHLEMSDVVSGELRSGAQRVALDDIGAIFVRPADIRQALRNRGERAGTPAHDHAIEIERKLFVWTDIADALVVNRPSAMAANTSKPLQLESIRDNGFEVPPTLVTTTPDTARDFIDAQSQVIYKSVSGRRSIVTRIDRTQIEYLDDVTNCPTQFQAHIPGVDWRVHVIGNVIHACQIRCEADDYRAAHRQGAEVEFTAVALPPSIAMRCQALARDLNLPLAGIDLRRTADDVWYCFEVNPSPAFTYYEQMTGQPITPAVAQLLIDACRGAPEASRQTTGACA